MPQSQSQGNLQEPLPFEDGDGDGQGEGQGDGFGSRFENGLRTGVGTGHDRRTAAGPSGGATALADTLSRRALPAEAGVWDELRGPGSDSLRPVWQDFAAAMPVPDDVNDLGADLDRRVQQVAQQLRRDGVTHNVFGPQGVAARPWSLELLPLLIEAADWAAIEAGVIQRAELLQRMLADLYGPGPGHQRLLHEGLLPPALLLRHPGYLRPMQGVRPAGGLALHIVAFDIARGAEGRWWVVAQRTQGPSGLGYVMHNRLVVSRQFPDAFRELRVQHIASSYRRMLDTVEAMARDVAGGATPRIALLTPGPYSETYFEHAYLARYLGLPLVEGGDLTVRDDHLYLKTVAGLEPVHGLLRRLDDDFCDPLELRPDSVVGVPGLLQAARAGTVVMANALGSAFLESPAVQGFLPAIARRLMGDDLQLPSLPTWWCGEGASWDDVKDELADKFVRSTFPRDNRTSQLHTATRSELRADVEADPDAWTAQGRIRFSRAPIWGAGMVTPRPAMVRVYAVADGDGRWHVLPGGMTRVARREDSSVSMQRGGSSLDTWVLTDGPVDTYSMLPALLRVDDIAARRGPVSSRTGENLFWLGRYTERTEQSVALARATLLLIVADTDATEPVQRALSMLAVRTGLAPAGVPSLVHAPHLFERALLASLGDTKGAGGATSVAYNLEALARASQALRERLSSEQWGLIRGMGEQFALALHPPPTEGELGEVGALNAVGAVGPGLDRSARQGPLRGPSDGPPQGPTHGPPPLSRVLPALDRLAVGLAAVTGAQTDRMARDHGWRLLTVGRLLERLIGLTTQLGTFVEVRALDSAAGIELLLELFDSAISFRARYQRHEDLLALTELLVLDNTNPRSLAGVLRRLRTEIGKLPGTPESLQEFLDLLPAQGAGLTLEELRDADNAGIAACLSALCERLDAAGKRLAEAVGERYFTPAAGADQRV